MSGGDLTSAAAVKRWLGVSGSGDDDVIAAIVTSVSRAILADLGRSTVLPTLVTEERDGAGTPGLWLGHWPVTQLVACVIGGQPAPMTNILSQTGVRVVAGEGPPPGAPQLLAYENGIFPRGRRNVVVTYRAGYQVTDEPAVVPTAPPYTCSVLAPFGSFACDVGVAGAQGSYTATGGLYTFTAADAGAAVRISYGYVPADLEQAAIEWAADRYMARTRIGQASKTLGGQETVSFIVKPMPDVVARLLQPYRRVAP